ncbi:MAG: hypothetical protein V4565_13345 [Bacteroidota bacterium]
MKKISIHCADISIESDDLIKVVLFDDIDFEIKDAIELLQAFKELTAGNKYYMLTITNDSFNATSEVREYVAKNISSTGIIANAILIKSLPIRLIINAYVIFNKPNIPTKTFNTESVALEWIEDIRKSNYSKSTLVKSKNQKNLIY